MPARLNDEKRRAVLVAVADGATLAQAAETAGCSPAAAMAIKREAAAAIDGLALQQEIGKRVAEYVLTLADTMVTQARLLGDVAWLSQHSDVVYNLAQSNRIAGDCLIRYLQTWGLSDRSE